MTDNLDKIIDKISKLLTKAEGTDNEAEAQTFFEKAHDLMREYAIEEEQLLKADPKAQRDIELIFLPLAERDELRLQKIDLYNVLARHNNCRLSLLTTHAGATNKAQVLLAGHHSDLQFTQLLFASVWIQLTSEKAKAWKNYDGKLSRFKFHKQFSMGYVSRISERFTELSEARGNDGTGTSLVLYDRSAAVDSFLNDYFGCEARNVNRRSEIVSADVYDAGQAAAETADISGGRNAVKA